MIKRIKDIFYQEDGRFTEELRLKDSPLSQAKLPAAKLPDGIHKMVCGFCATGCSLDVHIKAGEAINVTPNSAYPVNIGEACPKGWEALTPLKADDRAVVPQLRDAKGQMKDVSWNDGVWAFVDNFKTILAKYGPESVAFLSTGQIPTEEMAALGVLAKFGMGLIHGDGNTRQCMATAVTAYKQSFGFDAPPYTYKDFEESDCLVFVGANPCIAHPIMWQRVSMNPHQPNIVVIDPRKTETAMAATHHYAPRPKSDLALFYGIAHILIENQWIKEDYINFHTVGFDRFAAHVKSFTPEHTATVTGLSVEQIHEFASLIHAGKRVSFWWTMGVNQSHEATRTAQAMINLALMTGNIGRPGTGANSITGQCNAMGSRLYSNTTNLLGGHDFTNEAHRRKIADILDIDVARIPDVNSWSYDKIMEGVASGKIKGLWIIATNPAHSWIGRSNFKDVMSNLEFCVVQDMYTTTETAQFADLVLPAAGWGEKEGTFINSERRFGRIKRAATPPGEAKSDFEIFKLIAERWGCAEVLKQWQQPEDVFKSFTLISRDQPCDISGISDYAMLEAAGGIQWPFPEGKKIVSNERRLFADGEFYHEDGKARFLFEDIRPKPEPVCAEYPLELLTGRGTSAQWHTQTRTGKSPILRKMYPQKNYVEINPVDARKANIEPQQMIVVSTRRAKIKARAVISPLVQAGHIFIPMHYPETNLLTLPCFDPYSRQPAYKSCAARISCHAYDM